MRTDSTDHQAFELLSQANEQYERYVELARLAEIPGPTDQAFGSTVPENPAPISFVVWNS